MKTHIMPLLSFPLAFLCILLCFSVLLSSLSSHLCAAVPALGADTTAPVILLDAGHGGEDGGATGTNGILEKDLNLALTRILADLLRGAGFHVVECRTEDKLLYDEGTKKGHKKQSDLENRLKFTTAYPNCVFVSIHMNTFPTSDCTGLQVWYSPNHPSSKVLAETVQKRVKDLLQAQNNRRVKAATSGIYILRHAQTPATLIECGFLSTPSECELLCREGYQKMLALAIFSAISQNLSPDSCENA